MDNNENTQINAIKAHIKHTCIKKNSIKATFKIKNGECSCVLQVSLALEVASCGFYKNVVCEKN